MSKNIPRNIRRLAFEAIFQLDVRLEDDAEFVRTALLDHENRSEEDVERAMELALAAFGDRRAADQAVRELAPTWPAHRQPGVDRAILRLAHYEMTSGVSQPKVAVNEAVELAKRYSTERSPAFVNGVLDKVLKRVLRESDADANEGESQAEMPSAEKPTAGSS